MKKETMMLTPWAIFIALYFSLALHMFGEFDGYPAIGTDGFSQLLKLHSAVTGGMFSMLAVASLIILPIGWLVGLLKSRRWLSATNWFFVGLVLTIILMRLAPADFIYWWWD